MGKFQSLIGNGPRCNIFPGGLYVHDIRLICLRAFPSYKLLTDTMEHHNLEFCCPSQFSISDGCAGTEIRRAQVFVSPGQKEAGQGSFPLRATGESINLLIARIVSTPEIWSCFIHATEGSLHSCCHLHRRSGFSFGALSLNKAISGLNWQPNSYVSKRLSFQIPARMWNGDGRGSDQHSHTLIDTLDQSAGIVWGGESVSVCRLSGVGVEEISYILELLRGGFDRVARVLLTVETT